MEVLEKLGRPALFEDIARGLGLEVDKHKALRAALKAGISPVDKYVSPWLHGEPVLKRGGVVKHYVYSLPPADDAGLDTRRASHAAAGALPNVTLHNPPAASAAPATPTRHCA